MGKHAIRPPVKSGSSSPKINCRHAKADVQGKCIHKQGSTCNKPGQGHPCKV